MRRGTAVSAIGHTGHSDDSHSPDAWASVVVRRIRPASLSIAVVCTVASGTVLNFVCGLGTMGREELSPWPDARIPRSQMPFLINFLVALIPSKTAFDPNGLLDDLKKALAERALNAEIDHHLAKRRGRQQSKRLHMARRR